MSKPRYKWWGYVKSVIRSYPNLKEQYDELHMPQITPVYKRIGSRGSGVSDPTALAAIRELPRQEQREYVAVRQAIEETKQRSGGKLRLRVIDMVLFNRSHTLQGAALEIHISRRTARRYHTEFIYLVAYYLGFIDEK